MNNYIKDKLLRRNNITSNLLSEMVRTATRLENIINDTKKQLDWLRENPEEKVWMCPNNIRVIPAAYRATLDLSQALVEWRKEIKS
ncbi:hypothetical protein HMPREF7215_2601 [Pyramidobacter piscolens W5455]|uniref:Uncharacterized protein n=1 Tax=Pyramidobacter piscolens W5455 TaxID=352165 RepID=A0ABM9ZSI1_9BACT|nr:hypothetical protein [Pyramidobacter piscolens]EFB89787.1 hypothetical protein HMPREF7215_2601 [Pyramidobacter piscolens W5455]